MTAVEYLFKKYELTGDISNSQWDKAREMHKEEVETSYMNGCNESSHCADWAKQAEEYYKQTFKK